MRKKRKINNILIVTISLLLFCSILLISLFLKIRPILLTSSKNTAKNIMLNAANEAVINTIADYNISYDKIARLTRNTSGEVTSVEIDVAQINLFKSAISSEISNIISKNREFKLKIPIGTLTGNEYLVGLGPNLPFNMKMSEVAVVDFKSEFFAAGINNVLHRIIIEINLNASILMVGATDNFSVTTTAIAAQTVIIGVTPDTFTNVEEYPGDEIADELFNFADLE